jgi:phosphoglycolate phosphatase-like HAD superfamily hydrolase
VNTLVLFDIDGTLFQTDRVTIPAVQQTLSQFGCLVPDAETICRRIGSPVWEYHAWLARQCPADLAATIVAATDARELALIAEAGALYPGVCETLDHLSTAGAILAAYSNGPENYVAAILDTFGLHRLLSAVRVRGNAPNGKEAMIGQIMEMFPTHRTVVVGDRKEDITAAHANGALAVGALYGFGAANELQDADACVAAADEVPATIRRLTLR